MKQIIMFPAVVKETRYSTGIEVPVYEPKNRNPSVYELYDNAKAMNLIARINESSLPEQEKRFLIQAAYRHVVFNYELIADFYAHANKEVQELMEESALVIIDFNKAIELGYVKVCEDIKHQYMEDYIGDIQDNGGNDDQ